MYGTTYRKMQSLINKPIRPMSIGMTRQPRTIKVKAIPDYIADPVVQDFIRIFGKMTTLSIGFYCGLQYLYYKEMRENKKKDDN
jgi:hypothetical protein